jgi:hypothetical protein
MSNLTPEDEALLQRARNAGLPTEDDHGRVKRKLLVQIGVGIGVGTSAISTTSGAGAGLSAAGATAASGAVLSVVAKVAIAVALVGGAVGAGVVAVRGSSSQTKRPAPTTNATQSVPPTAIVPASTGEGSFEAPATTPTASTGAVSPLPKVTRVAAPVVPLPPSSAQARSSPLIPESAVFGADPPRSPGAGPVAADAPIAPQAPAGPATVAAEAELLRQADAARKAGDAPRALALLDEHRTRFANGVLVQEREAERVVVLCALGRAEEARSAAAVFLRDWPRSPLAGRVRATCGGH